MYRTAVWLPITAGAATFAVAVALPGAAGQGPSTTPPTYSASVGKILNRSCVPCHRPGEVAPFSLVGYENAKKWSPMIAAVTSARRMPPWKAVHGFGEFLDENRLTAQEIETLAAWDKSGAPRGDQRKEPKPPTFSSAWQLGEPDLILQPERSFKIAAEGEDVYRNFVIKHDFKKPTWVRAMAVRPGSPKSVHHVITFIDATGESYKLEEAAKDGQIGYRSNGGGVGFRPAGALGGWAPGMNVRPTPQGTAFLIRPGSTLVVQVHYTRTGKPEEDLTKLGLYFAKEPPKRELMLDWILNFGVNITPGDEDYKISTTRHVSEDITIYGGMPHMHLLGKSMKAWVELPNGSTKPIVWVDDWDFKWQMQYTLKEPVKAPKGSKIRIEAVYDNSENNPRNPSSPPKRVRYGEKTTDEMCLLVLAHSIDAERE